MGRLLRIEAENFKSYAGHQVIGPFKDFTAVIGPNGAGKSNLMDAISFVLGVQSRHLRSTKLSDLVFRADGNVASSRRAMVKVVYMVGGGEVEGIEDGEEIHFSRVISASGASSYRLNDREVTWDGYEKRLREIGVLVKARNFLVFQGDVESIASKSNKELAQLFEQISGSDEFKTEYEELKAAKDKAEEDTIFSFNRKKGCQAEKKQVKEQKEEAERFKRKLKEIEELKVESFLVQIFHINRNVDEHEEEIRLMREELQEAEAREKEAADALKAKKKKLAGLNRNLQRAQDELHSYKKRRDDLGPKRVKIKEGIKTLERQVADGEKALERIEKDRDEQRGSIEALQRDIAANKKREESSVREQKRDEGRARLSEDKAAEYESLKAEAREKGSGQRQAISDIERKLASVRSSSDQLRDEEAALAKRVSNLEESAKQLEQRRGDMERTSKKAALDRAELHKELQELEGRSAGDAQKAAEIERKLTDINEQLRDARDDRRMTKHQEEMAECLERLKRMHPGVRGRLVDLCKPTQRKYNLAVTTAAGKHMEAIVVDTKAEALECVTYMRNNKIGKADFIPLDSIKVKPLNERLRSLGPRNRLCADIMQGDDEGVRRAILFAVGNTVVSDTLDDARQLCFGRREGDERIKAVTLNGAMINKWGMMTGGTTERDLGRAAQWDEKEFSGLKKQREHLEREREAMPREHRNRALRTELRTKVDGLASRQRHSSAQHDIANEDLQRTATQMEGAVAERDKVASARVEQDAAVQELEAELETLQAEVDKIENEVFDDFLKSVGATNIRAFEEGQLKDMHQQLKARMKLRQHTASLEAHLSHEQSRDFEGPLAKLTEKIAGRRHELAEHRREREALKEEERAIMLAEDDASKAHLAARDEARTQEGEVKAAVSTKNKLAKAREDISKSIAIEESALEKLRASLHAVLREASVEQVPLPLVGGGVLGEGRGGSESGSRKRARDGSEMYDNDGRESASQENGSTDERSLAASSEQLSGSQAREMDLSHESSSAHFSQAQSRSVQEDRAEALKVDLTKLKRHRGTKEPGELDDLILDYKKKMEELQVELNKLTPNMRAVERFDDVAARLKSSGETFEQSKQKAAGAVFRFNEVKDKRYNAFMQAFNHVSKHLSTIYKDLTRSSKHLLGGNAYLSLDNPEEPYLGGVKFNAMPPMKRFRDMEQLSGGEKTVAALALLFAIHSFRPAPFFVMDEIDAALDNINVKKVCSYIQRRSDDFQSIVISLKDMFYEKADALVGICRDRSTNSSRTLTLDLQAVAYE